MRLTDWQRAEIIDRVADKFSPQAKQTLDAVMPDVYLLELWNTSFPGEPLPTDEAARYAQLVAQMKREPSMSLWREIEAIKNRHGGLAPAAGARTAESASSEAADSPTLRSSSAAADSAVRAPMKEAA